MVRRSSDLLPRAAGPCSRVVRPDPTAAREFWRGARVLATLDLRSTAAAAHGRAREPALAVQSGAPLRRAQISRWLSDLAEASRVAGPLQAQHPIALAEVELRLTLDGPLIADA